MAAGVLNMIVWQVIYNRPSSLVTFQEQQYLSIGSDIDSLEQDHIVSLSGDGLTLAIGYPSTNDNVGETWTFSRPSSDANFTRSGPILVDALSHYSLSYDGLILAVGGPCDNNDIGATWIYTRSSASSNFTQQHSTKLVGTVRTRITRHFRFSFSFR